jgi:uncharacterized protein (TIGR03083 family)
VTTPPFADLLALIEDRSAALREAAAAVALDSQVPCCPDWSLEDLVGHLAGVQRFWAAAVAAGPAAGPPDDGAPGGRAPGVDILAWSVDSTAALLVELDAAGPDRGCWTWWGRSAAPMTSGAVARHQVQEAAVHARDAQETAGRAEPLPTIVARDGVAEFVSVGLGAAGPWPHSPARIALHSDEGDRWLVSLGETGAGLVAGSAGAPAGVAPGRGPEPSAAVYASASDLVLVLYRRKTLDDVRVTGDRVLVERLASWSPTG